MKKFDFAINVETEQATGRTMAVYFRIRQGKSAKTVELIDGTAFADYNSRGLLLGIELLAPCKVEALDKITLKEPEARRFIHGVAPREMVLA